MPLWRFTVSFIPFFALGSKDSNGSLINQMNMQSQYRESNSNQCKIAIKFKKYIVNITHK